MEPSSIFKPLIDYVLIPIIKFLCKKHYIDARLKLCHLLHDFICHNQGKYIEFQYSLYIKHKRLEEALKKSNNTDNIKIIESCYQEIDRYIMERLKQITQRSFSDLSKYFDMVERSEFKPKICLKVFMEKPGCVGNYYKIDAGLAFHESPIEEDTGLTFVHTTGEFYIQNNIPENAKKEEFPYTTPKLDQRRAVAYKNKKRFINLLKKSKRIDSNWCSCWKFDDDEKRVLPWQEFCAKSTLIIPMTLRNNKSALDVDSDFKKDFFYRNEEKDTWGFLCFDHPCEDYFDQELDKYIGFIFADTLSLYFLCADIYTVRSKYYNEAEDILQIPHKRSRT
ncbi:MAG: hypothetical protein HQK96_19315 [Nitrospirae bacterium]|nr:hypothetical protein [Nitrospirota bacterium]